MTTKRSRGEVKADLDEAAQKAHDAAEAAPGPLAAAPHRAMARTAEALSADLPEGEGDPASSPAEGPTNAPSEGSASLPATIGDRSPGIPPPEQGGMLIHPSDGTMIDPSTATPAELADWLDAVRDWENGAKAAKRILNLELHRRMDAEAKWTITEGEWKLTGQSPHLFEWDGDMLHDVLNALVREELITKEAAKSALGREVVYKPKVNGLNNLMKLGGEVEARLEECRQEKDPEARRISLGRS